MGLSLASLKFLADLNLSTEQMAGVVRVLTVELAPLEARRANAAARQSRYRDAHRNVDSSVTVDATVTLGVSRVDNLSSSTELVETVSKNLPLSPSEPKGLSEHPAFPMFWDVYPKRCGDRNRKGASKAFSARVRCGVDPQEIIAGAARYAAFCDQTEKTGTEFVKQARSWLNADGWTETYEISRSTPNGLHRVWSQASAVLAEQDRREGICRESSQDNFYALPKSEGRG